MKKPRIEAEEPQARKIIRDNLYPSDVLLPQMNPEDTEKTLFAVANTNYVGADAVTKRIRSNLAASPEFMER